MYAGVPSNIPDIDAGIGGELDMWGRPWRFERLGQTEIQHLHHAVRTQLDIRRLQVPVDDSVLVGRLQRLGDLARDRKRFVQWNGSSSHSLRKRRPIDELQYQRAYALAGCRLAFLEAVDGARCSDGSTTPAPALRARSGKTLRIGGEQVRQHLERDVPAQPVSRAR